MAWTPPTFTPGVVWQNAPKDTTPVDAADLNLEESSEASYAATVGTSVTSYFEGGSSSFGPPAKVVTAGRGEAVNQAPVADGAGGWSWQNQTGGLGGAVTTSALDGVLYVSKTGSDSTGDGTLGKPYLTVTGAVNAANSAINANTYKTVTIKLFQGRFTEEVWIVNPINLIAESGVPGTGYYAATVIEAPTDTANCINVIGSGANGVRIGGITTKGASATWKGIGIRGVGADQVKVDHWQHNNNASTPTKTVGGIGIAIGHGEKWQVNGYLITDAAQGIVLGVESAEEHFITGQMSHNYQDRYAGPFEVYRSAISQVGGITAVAATVPIHNSLELLSSGLGYVDSEGIAWTGNTGNQLTGVSRAVVGWLTSSITNVQTAGINVSPMLPGNQATIGLVNPNVATTIPASGTLKPLDGTEQISYTSWTSGGNGTANLQGVTRGANATVAVAHNSNVGCQDVALASAATHAQNAMVVQSYGTPNLAGAWGGGCTFDMHKGTNSVTISSDPAEQWYSGGHVFVNNDVEETGGTNAVHFYLSSNANTHIRPSIAGATTLTDDGSTSVYISPSGLGFLVFSASSTALSIINNNLSGGHYTDNGAGNFQHGPAWLGTDFTVGGPGGSPLATGAAATKTGNYTLTASDHTVLGDATAGAITLTLPTAVGFVGVYFVKAINTNNNLVTLATTGGQTIEGASTVTLGVPASGAPYLAATLISDGANWRIV